MNYEEKIKHYGSYRKAAKALNIPKTTLQNRVAKERLGLPDGPTLDKEGDKKHSIVPDGYGIKGTSTMYDADGVPRMQWVKTHIDPAVMAEIMETMRAEFAESLPRADPDMTVPTAEYKDLLTTYILTDYHLGMLACSEETGADWDIKIAEDMLVKYFRYAVKMSPASDTAILANIGDFLHFDGMLPVTPTSKHVLDADTRFQKLIRVAIRAMRLAVSILLEKHKHVRILHATGNHDESSAAWLRECFNVFYENEPRVTVDTRPDPYYCFEFGNTSLFFHHGHKRKVGNIETVFAGKFREIYGRTKYSYAHMGHFHSSEVKESNLMIIEQHRTLAAADAYSSSGGWLSGRSACAITYDREYGERSRVIVPAELLLANN